MWLTADDIFVELSDGEQSSLPIKKFPLLYSASPEERKKVEIIGGYALHWPQLNEDLSVAGFFEQKNDAASSQPLSFSKK